MSLSTMQSEPSIEKIIDLSHDDIMKALTQQPSHQSKIVSHLTCLTIFGYEHQSSSIRHTISKNYLQGIAEYFRRTYSSPQVLKFSNSHDEIMTELDNNSPSKECEEVFDKELEVNNEDLTNAGSSTMQGRDSDIINKNIEVNNETLNADHEDFNEIESSSLKNLSQELLKSKSEVLDLSYYKSPVGTWSGDWSGVYYLAQVLRRTQILKLYLSCNKIACRGLKYLTQGIVGSRLEILLLSQNDIKDDGVKYLAKNLAKTKILYLNLSSNKIACKGLKYLTQGIVGSRLEILDLSKNDIKDDGVQYLAKHLAKTKLVEVDLTGNVLENHAADQMLESVKLLQVGDKSMQIYLDVSSDKLAGYLSLYKYSDCFVEIWQTMPREDLCHLINKYYQKKGITNLNLEGDYFTRFLGALDNISITGLNHYAELKTNNHFKADEHLIPLSSKSNIVSLSLFLSSSSLQSLINLILKMKIIALQLRMLHFEELQDCCYSGSFKVALNNSNIVYLDFNNLDLEEDKFQFLVEMLKGSKIISLNLRNNKLGDNSAQLLAQVLPHTRITYINLHGNRIKYSGYKYLTNNLDKTSVCWLSLGSNNIEEGLPQAVELSPYIVPRCNTPIEFQIRYLFREIVALNKDSDQLEFVVASDDSVISINHYPIFVKQLLDSPDYKFHIYDYFYMLSMRHDVHVLNRVNYFVKDLEQNLSTFVESKMIQLVERFGRDCFLSLVEVCDSFNLFELVKSLLLHRLLYYVDEEQNFLHPFIYKMLRKHQMPLYNEDLEPDKKQQIISYFEQHSDINGAEELIDLLKEN